MTEGGHQGVTPSTDFEEEAGPTRQRDVLIGQQLGEFVIDARLGEGAMGIVYRGTQPLIGKAVAIKVLKPGFDDSGELLEEARAVSAAHHPNIIDVFSFGTTAQGQQYFVMELLEGDALDLWLRDRQLTALESVGILKQLLSGLAAAHAANVVHRDLKPGNLFMARLADGSHFLKILDFGLAKRVNPLAPEQTIGRMAGTPLYMSPEQTRGQATGPFTDLYAVGCIAFELLVGRPPFGSTNLVELLHHHQSSPPPALPASVHPLLNELVQSLLEKQPSARPASALAARQVVERVERRLLAASGTNVEHEAQSEVSVSPRVRAQVALAPREPRAPPAPSRPPPPRRVESDARATSVDRARAVPQRVSPSRPTLPAQELVLNDEASDLPTREQFEPWSPQARAPSRGRWALVLVPLVMAGAALAWALRPAERPVPIEALAPHRAEPPPPPVVQAPPPPDEALAVEAVPEQVEAPAPPAIVRPSTPSAAPVRATARKSPERRLSTLEERCLLELSDSKQRMALEDLKELRGELNAVAGDERQRMLDAFEAHWFKGSKR